MKIANWKPFEPVTSFADLDVGTVFAFYCNAHLCLKVSETDYFDFEDNEFCDIKSITEVGSVTYYPDAELWPGFPKLHRLNFPLDKS